MRNFSARVSDPNSFYSSAGCRTKTIYRSTFNGSVLVLTPDRVIDTQDSINSVAPFCDISYMLSRLRYGDNSVFSQSPPIYGDFTGIPKDPSGILSLIHDCEYRFDRMSEEERAVHGNDWRSYFLHICNNRSDSLSSSSDGLSPSEPNS